MREIRVIINNETACANLDILRQTGHNISEIITEIFKNMKIETAISDKEKD